jgi:molybdopterin synthase catalytic subunit
MRIHVRLFAICRERAGADHLDVDVPGDSATVKTLLDAVVTRAPRLAPLLPAVRVAVNQTFAGPDQTIGAEDEVALIPPVSGGASQRFVVTETSLDPREVEALVATGESGAVLTFQGTVRNHAGRGTPEDAGRPVTHLEYEAYDDMAVAFLSRIAQEAESRWPGVRVAVHHRKGRLAVGEVSVVIAVAHPHRAEAFDACRHVIERLKEDVPIWKKEIRADGSVWVGVGS